jgi:hypothetical protein
MVPMVAQSKGLCWPALAISCLMMPVSPSPGQGTAGEAGEPSKPWLGVHVQAWGLAGGPEGLSLLKEATEKVLQPLGVKPARSR